MKIMFANNIGDLVSLTNEETEWVKNVGKVNIDPPLRHIMIH